MAEIDSSPIYVGEGLEAAGQKINASAAEIEAELTSLRSALQPLIDAWVAQSSEYYQERMHEWDMAAVQLFGDSVHGGVLGTIADVMNVNWTNYTEAEEANIKTWQYGAR
ncbi:WXG100 family type VII secretion target [Streptomyces sp. NPDC001380]|uniref:WXG100 family type VII secretion target n=1 Tax=Streptomyces sp. NPDC001380 TaxID=3364566 RepID=UPI0036AD30C4